MAPIGGTPILEPTGTGDPMCFSAEADLVMGVAVTAIGIDAMRHVSKPADRALGALPIVLGAHLLTENVVWRGLQGEVSDGVWRPFLYAYLIIAFVVVPILVPVAVGALEPERNRRRAAAFIALAVVVATVLLHALLTGPVDAAIDGRHLAYRVDLWGGGAIVLLYVVATCGALMASSHRHVRWFGLVNLVVVTGLAVLDKAALVSLWCAWAAVVSIAIAWHLRRPGGTFADEIG